MNKIKQRQNINKKSFKQFRLSTSFNTISIKHISCSQDGSTLHKPDHEERRGRGEVG